MNNKGQVTIFIIVAIILVAGVAVYFAVSGGIFTPSISEDFNQIYQYYEQCISQESKAAIDLAGSQGGHLKPGEYIPGSDYAPSASQLNFLGFPIPYWYYISSNGVVKEQVPSQSQIENELSEYIGEKLKECDFSQFYEKGYSIDFGEQTFKVSLEDSKVLVEANGIMTVSQEERSASKNKQSVEVDSSFGLMYKEAKKIYTKEKKESFLENYSVDVLRLYAPVDGVEISCSPKVWKSREVSEEIRNALEANIGAIKFKGGEYSLQKEENKYFVVDESVSSNVRLLYSKTWPSKIEIEGADGELMMAQPVGIQEGLGVLGFCYSPYHFVYDISYPVLVQIYDGEEVFQFPIVVVIDKNMPRQGIFSELDGEQASQDICEFNTQDVIVNTFDKELNPVNSSLSYICFDQRCNLGNSQGGKLEGKAPACLNGYILARAEGYSDSKQLFSTNSENSADILLEREYEVNISVKVDGTTLKDNALVSFNGMKSASVMLPESRSIKISEGDYNISVSVYGNSSIIIPKSSKNECRDVPQGGLLGFFGSTEEQCFEISIPETKIEYALAGGGSSESYILESQLQKGELTLNVKSLPRPTSLQQLQYNYESYNSMGVDVE